MLFSLFLSSTNVIFVILLQCSFRIGFLFLFSIKFFSLLFLFLENWKSRQIDKSHRHWTLNQNKNKQIWKIMKRTRDVLFIQYSGMASEPSEWRGKKVRSSCSLWNLNFVHVLLFFHPRHCYAVRAHQFN